MKTPLANGPLILGASGRIGRMWQTLWRCGHWPSSVRPVWHGRSSGEFDVEWDMTGAPPRRLPPVRGMIVLAGRTNGAVEENARIAISALDLAQRNGIEPVLICSSSAVYGRAVGPQREAETAIPVNAYGQAKLEMERAVADHPVRNCVLRIANVAGADAALLNAEAGNVKLDRFPDGQSPRRMYVGPKTLAQIMLDLLKTTEPLPTRLNLAQPGVISMASLLDAADAQWTPVEAAETALPELTLDLSLLAGLIPLTPATANSLVAEARLAGWGRTA